jgi:hypothetical protein
MTSAQRRELGWLVAHAHRVIAIDVEIMHELLAVWDSMTRTPQPSLSDPSATITQILGDIQCPPTN